MKRAFESESGEQPRKRIALQAVQKGPAHTEPASQLPLNAGSQLMRSITVACALAGFDSITPSALEMFRAQAEEYMLKFSRDVRLAMQTQRRAQPTAQDFGVALSRTENTRAARVLRPQLDLKLPPEIACPSIPEPPPAPEEAPNLSALLQPLIETRPPSWIPKHFPILPPQHAWKSTDVWPTREKDARRMRERATEEGMLAEQALRKLAAAAKAGAMKADAKRRTGQALSGVGKQRGVNIPKRPDNEDIFGELLAQVDAQEGEDGEARRDKPADLELSEGMLVNSAAAHWRGGKRQGVAF